MNTDLELQQAYLSNVGRRKFVFQIGAGFGSVALSWLLDKDNLGATASTARANVLDF